MKHEHWMSPSELSALEKKICSRLKNTGKLFVFLRKNRELIFSDEIKHKLLLMYSDYPRGRPAISPTMLGMVTILQAYEQLSDAAAVLESLFDKRWQMVLGCLGIEQPLFSQGALCDFRHRLVKHNLDVLLLEQTVKVAKEVGGFSHKQLRIALDSAPLEGAGRVEDTFNLIGHALELVLDCAAQIKGVDEAEIIQEAGTNIIGQSSIKAALDIDWSDPSEKKQAINTLLNDVDSMRQWLKKQDKSLMNNQYLKESLSLLEHVLVQNTEPDPDGGSKIIDGVEADRRISISDGDMRHGRKSSSRTINGFKQHIAIDLDHKLVLATSVRPANEPEHKSDQWLQPKVEKYGEVVSKHIDKGYLASTWTAQLHAQGKKVVAKPWNPATQGKFGKKDFTIDLKNTVVICPSGNKQRITGKPGSYRAKFSSKVCSVCPIKNKCSNSKTGRTIQIHDQEAMLQGLKVYTQTAQGRSEARERVKVEHVLASICNRKGPRARYLGLRLNEYDLNRTAMVTNLHVAMNMAA